MSFLTGNRHGAPTAERLERMSIPEPTSGCTLWLGHAVNGGYGMVRHDGRSQLAHRVAWELANGPIPDGLVIDHLCRVRSCINPAHMRVVTQKVNVLCGEAPSAANARKALCHLGHPLDMVLRSGSRSCRTCHNTRNRKNKALARERRQSHGVH